MLPRSHFQYSVLILKQGSEVDLSKQFSDEKKISLWHLLKDVKVYSRGKKPNNIIK